MPASRIPDLVELSPDGMLMWFAELSARGLIFHPEEPPREIYYIADGKRMFTNAECKKLERILSSMFAAYGDGVIDACYPIFMHAAGQMTALDS